MKFILLAYNFKTMYLLSLKIWTFDYMDENNETLMMAQEVLPSLSFILAHVWNKNFKGNYKCASRKNHCYSGYWRYNRALRATDCSEMKGIHVSFKLTALYSVPIQCYRITALEWIWIFCAMFARLHSGPNTVFKNIWHHFGGGRYVHILKVCLFCTVL
jgi:hypothetical protein